MKQTKMFSMISHLLLFFVAIPISCIFFITYHDSITFLNQKNEQVDRQSSIKNDILAENFELPDSPDQFLKAPEKQNLDQPLKNLVALINNNTKNLVPENFKEATVAKDPENQASPMLNTMRDQQIGQTETYQPICKNVSRATEKFIKLLVRKYQFVIQDKLVPQKDRKLKQARVWLTCIVPRKALGNIMSGIVTFLISNR